MCFDQTLAEQLYRDKSLYPARVQEIIKNRDSVMIRSFTKSEAMIREGRVEGRTQGKVG